MRIALEEALQATGGRVTGPPARDQLFDGVSTDTRTLRPGRLFVALRGERFDGHDYLEEARKRGAAGVLIHRGPGLADIPSIHVGDTLEALGALGRLVRRRMGFKVVAVTGSVGKTTTKELIAALLRGAGLRTLQTPGNWNNRVGLPLTLFEARGDEEGAVLELGISEPGEMAHLTAICEPDVAVVTAAAEVHTEGLGGLDEVAREKLGIAAGLKPGGTLILPHGDPLLRAPPGVRVATFGWAAGADVRGEDFEWLGTRGCCFRVGGERICLALPGRYNADNALAALAAVRCLGVSWEGAATSLSAVRPAPLRGELRSSRGGVHLLVDCYNANPRAVEAALTTLKDLAGPARKIAVLGEMRELGALSAQAHARVGRAAARLGVDELHLLGRATAWTREAAAAEGLAADRIWVYDDREALAASVGRRLHPGDWVLVKGSRSLGLEAVADRLEAGGYR